MACPTFLVGLPVATDDGLLQPVPTLVDGSVGATVVVDGDLLCGVALPDQVRNAIAIKIGHLHDGPTGDTGIELGETVIGSAAGAAEIMDDHLIGAIVLKYQIGNSVAIEVVPLRQPANCREQCFSPAS